MSDLTKYGKILASAGAVLTAVGISLPLTNDYREMIVAFGVFVTAVSAFLAHHEIKKNGDSKV